MWLIKVWVTKRRTVNLILVAFCADAMLKNSCTGACRYAMSDGLANVYNYDLTPRHVPCRSVSKVPYVAIGDNQEQVRLTICHQLHWLDTEMVQFSSVEENSSIFSLIHI